MIKNFGQIIEEVKENIGAEVLDESTTPKLSRVKSHINDTIREMLSEFNFRQLETACSYPFWHTLYGVQGAFLTGTSATPLAGSGISASFIPYQNSLLNGCLTVESYSGIAFLGTDSAGTSYSGVSTDGYGISGNIKTIGYTYELGSDIEQIYSITIPSRSIKLNYIPQYDLDMLIPQGLTTSSGTPSYYTNFPGLSQSGNIVIKFYSSPEIALSGNTFAVHYKQKHRDMNIDTDVQRVIPEQFQDIIIDGALEKTYAFLNDEKSVYHGKRKQSRLLDYKIQSENNLDYVNRRRDGNFLGNSQGLYNQSILFKI